MERFLRESVAIVKKRTEVEELEKEHQELRTRLAELQLDAEAKNCRDLKTALESIDDIRRDLTEIRQNNGTTEEQILSISSKLENVEKRVEETMKTHFDEKETTAAKLEEMEEQAMVMSREMQEREKNQKIETEQKLKIMEKALEEQKEKLQKGMEKSLEDQRIIQENDRKKTEKSLEEQKEKLQMQQISMEKALEDQRIIQEKLGESTKNLQKAQENIAKLERTCGITNEQMQNMTAKIEKVEKLLNETVKWQRETSESRRMDNEKMEKSLEEQKEKLQKNMEKALEDQGRIREKDRKKTEEALEEQRKLNVKLSAKLAWLEDKRTILMLRGTGTTKELLIFNRETSQWKTSPVELPEAGGTCGMICLGQEIYIFGEGLGSKTFKLKELEKQGESSQSKLFWITGGLFYKEMKWDRMADMNEGRGSIMNSFLLFDGCIWVFGGLNQLKEDLNTVEKYIPSENKWIKMPRMNQKRRCAAAAVCGGKIYVCGGNFGEGANCTALKSVECFDPKGEVWTKFVDLPNPAWGMGVISDGGCLIIYGGSDRKTSFKNVWKINPNDANPTWNELPSMKEERYFLTVQSIGKRIFAIGGVDRKSVEIFDGTSWKSGPELPEICRGVPSVVIPHSLAAELLPM